MPPRVPREPKISYSPQTHRWSIVTRYKLQQAIDAETGEVRAYVVALTTHDVTEQMTALLKRFGIGDAEVRNHFDHAATP